MPETGTGPDHLSTRTGPGPDRLPRTRTGLGSSNPYQTINLQGFRPLMSPTLTNFKGLGPLRTLKDCKNPSECKSDRFATLCLPAGAGVYSKCLIALPEDFPVRAPIPPPAPGGPGEVPHGIGGSYTPQ